MVYVFVSDGFEEIEAVTVIDVLRRAGTDVKTVGVGAKTVTGRSGIPITADITAEQATSDGLEMIVLPGGMPGTLNLQSSPAVNKLIRYCAANGLYIGAICAAPMILGQLGLLEGRKAVCFPGFENKLSGALIQSDEVCRDGGYITSVSAGTAVPFALRLIDALYGAEKAESVRKEIIYR